jgi:NADH pyrophosphatase NudC (nudix superfamily)
MNVTRAGASASSRNALTSEERDALLRRAEDAVDVVDGRLVAADGGELDRELIREWQTWHQAHLFTCGGCGGAFYSRREDTKFCSNACRQRAYRERRAGRP